MHTATVNRAPDEGHEPLRPRLLRPQLRHLNSNEKEGTTVKSTWHAAKSASTKLGLFATLRACLRAHGSGARKISRRLAAPTGVLGCFLASVAGAALLPQAASAYATIEGPPLFSSAPGLPDGRVYEQVSPADKNGNQAGASTVAQAAPPGHERYSVAAANGDSVLFEGTGAMGEVDTNDSTYYVASKDVGAVGWSTRAALPRPQQSGSEAGTGNTEPGSFDPSADLTHAMSGDVDDTLAPLSLVNGQYCLFSLYLTGPDPFSAGTWLARPSAELANPITACGYNEDDDGSPVGGTPDFSTVYFSFPGTLLPEDAPRVPHTHLPQGLVSGFDAWGFYEDREGVLHEAGVLPNGTLDPFGAVPAASGRGRALAGNQISTQPSPDGAPSGSRAFFVSPDPGSCTQSGGENDCTTDPPELYVRENGETTLLVSRDALLPDVGGLPAPAPGGALQMVNPTQPEGYGVNVSRGSYVFAAPDGSQAFFQSTEDLTEAAKDASPGNEPKTYDFDVETGALTYLPGVVGQLLVTDADGSSLAFVRPAAGPDLPEIDLWSAGPDGGSVKQVTQLPETETVNDSRISSDGSILVFITASRLSGALNSGGYEQVYRYDSATNTLGCVSCAPAGVTPAGGASISQKLNNEGYGTPAPHGMVDKRGISSDGDRVFFETQTPLVPQDTNTNAPIVEVGQEEYEKQGMDVYEWENGVVYLISSGKSPRDSYFLDNSENGDDVFFATTEGLVPGDTDGAYDVYDARVPQPGDTSPPAGVPCEGSVCQGPPSVPAPLTASASSTFSGLGNAVPEPAAASVARPKPTPKATRCKKGDVRKKSKCVKKPKAKTHKRSK